MKQREALTMVAQLKFKLMLLGLVCTMIYSPFVLADLEVVEWVQRRQSGDFYSYVEQLTIEHDRCPRNASSSDTTFMINQRECVEDQELYAGCRYAILASSSPLIAVVFNINSDPLSIKHLVTNDREVAETFYFNRSDKLLLNSSFCHIASLEVVRGWEQVIEIDHDGFSLSDNATIEINPAMLMYSLEDYQGELYRLNISCICTTSDLRQTGCLYFKVVGQNSRSNVTYAKFNCTVPGTLADFNDECNVTNTTNTSEEDQVSETQTQTDKYQRPVSTQMMTSFEIATVTLAERNGTLADMTTSSDSSNSFTTMTANTSLDGNTSSESGLVVGSVLFYVVVILCAGFVVATIVTSGCIAAWVISKRKRRSGSVAVTSVVGNVGASTSPEDLSLFLPIHMIYESIDHPNRLNTREASDSVSLSKCIRNPAYIHLGPRREERQAAAETRVDSSPISKSPPKCIKNPAYIHLGPEDETQQPILSVPKGLQESEPGYTRITSEPLGSHSHNLASIRLHMGGETAVISIGRVVKDSLYVNVDAISSSKKESIHHGTPDTVQNENCDALLVSFSKCTNHTCATSPNDPSQNTDGSSVTTEFLLQDQPHAYVDLQQKSSQAVLISLRSGEDGRIIEVDKDENYSSVNASKSSILRNPTYVNLDPEETSSGRGK